MESELNRVVDVLPGLVWTALPDGHVDFVNQGWHEYTGHGLDEARGHAWQRIVYPDDLPGLLDRWQTILASAGPGDMEARLRRFDGVYRLFVLRVRPLIDSAGKLIKWCGVNTDVDAYQRRDDHTRAPEADFRPVLDSIPGSVTLMTPAGGVEYVNRHGCIYRGATLEKLRRWKTSGSIHPDDLPAAIARWTRSLQAEEPYDGEQRIRGADGVHRWFHVRGLPVRDEHGRITRWCFLDVDIDDVRASEDRLRNIIDTVPGFVWSATPDGRVEFINQRWCDYTGMALRDALGFGWTSAVHPDDATALASYWQGLLETGQAGEYEARLRRVDGSYRWFLIRAVPQRDGAGHLVKWYGGNTDIDDRKRAEMLLAGEKRLLGMMAGGSPLAPILAEVCGLVETLLDGSLCSIVLVDRPHTPSPCDDAPGLRLQPGSAPHLPPGLVQGADGCVADADADPVALAAIRNEQVISIDLMQETRWSAWCATALSHGIRANWSIPIAATTGKVVGILSILYRQAMAPTPAHRGLITQFTHLANIAIARARGEAALKQSEAFLAKAQRLSLTGSFSWKVSSDEITWSEEIYRIGEIDPSVAPTFDLIFSRTHPEDVPALNEMFKRQRGDGRDFEHEHRLLLPDGRVKYVHLVAHATRDENGGLEYIAAIQDVTQRRLSEEALGKVRSELAHVARVASLGALTASIAHEVNQPLAGIVTNANTCLRMLGADPPNVDGARETARRTIRDGNRASDVIKRLRALFAKKDVLAEPFDLNEAAREVIAMLLGELQRNGVILYPEFADNLPPVKGDRVQLQQVILNLILNASDAMQGVTDRPRHMRVSTMRDDGGLRLAVRDNGTGFDPQDADRLFNAFYTTKHSGMGIGLSVSRSIIEGHGGRLLAAVNDGPGATFSFSIPELPEPVASADADVQPDTGADADTTVVNL